MLRASRATYRAAGAAEGSIIAAVIVTQIPRYHPSPPRSVPGPASIPRIRSTVTAQATAARPSVAVSGAAVLDVLVLVMPAQRKVRVTSVRDLVEQLGVVRSEQEAVGRSARVRVVDVAVLSREDIPTRCLGHPMGEIGADVVRPIFEPV